MDELECIVITHQKSARFQVINADCLSILQLCSTNGRSTGMSKSWQITAAVQNQVKNLIMVIAFLPTVGSISQLHCHLIEIVDLTSGESSGHLGT